jgi:CRP/FNR family transcriptional regulator
MVDQADSVIRKLDIFFASHTPMAYKRGETIVRAEDAPLGVYYLKSGFVHQYIISPSGETFMVHIFKPGSFFPLMWIVNNTPNIFHYEAMTPTHIVRAPKDQFNAFLRENPDVLYYATQRLAAGLSGLVNRVGQLVLDDAYTKTILLLLYYADNFGEKTAQGIELKLPLAHREIASWIGTTRETASLQVETLMKKGIIATKGRQIIIRNMAQLQKEITR